MSTSQECSRIRKLLPDFAAGKGTSRARASVRRHLDSCPECARELRALERTAELLNRGLLEPAPDLWQAIRPNLVPRRAHAGPGRLRWWFRTHRIQSAIAGVAAGAVIAVMMIVGPREPVETDSRIYQISHASMSWREPFADKAGLGLAGSVPFDSETEDTQ